MSIWPRRKTAFKIISSWGNIFYLPEPITVDSPEFRWFGTKSISHITEYYGHLTQENSKYIHGTLHGAAQSLALSTCTSRAGSGAEVSFHLCPVALQSLGLKINPGARARGAAQLGCTRDSCGTAGVIGTSGSGAAPLCFLGPHLSCGALSLSPSDPRLALSGLSSRLFPWQPR